MSDEPKRDRRDIYWPAGPNGEEVKVGRRLQVDHWTDADFDEEARRRKITDECHKARLAVMTAAGWVFSSPPVLA